MPVKEKTGTCKGFAFTLVPEHMQKEILKLNAIVVENRIIVMEDGTSTRKRDSKKLLKHPKINVQKIWMYSTPKNFQLE